MHVRRICVCKLRSHSNNDPIQASRAVQEMTERLVALEQKAGEHQQVMLRSLREFHGTLTGLETHLQARPGQSASVAPSVTAKPPAPFLAVTLRQIWKGAFLVSGVVYVLIDVLFVWGYWWPLWAAVAKLF